MRAKFRVIFGASSQGLTSLTNFAIIIGVSKTQSPEVVGFWSLGFAIVTLATTLGRAAVATPIVIEGVNNLRRDVGGGVQVAAAFGSLSALALLSLALLGGIPADIALPLAVSAVFAVPQDFMRYAWIARDRPDRALLLDLTWVVALATIGIALALSGFTPVWAITLAWGGGAAASMLVGLVIQPAALAAPRYAIDFIRVHRRASIGLAGESAANAISANAQPFIATATDDVASAGALRVGQTLFAPLTTLIAALSPVILRELSIRTRNGSSTRPLQWLWAAALTASFVLYTTVIFLIPDSVGIALVGTLWPAIAALLPALAAQALIRPAQSIATLSLRAKKKFRLLLVSSWVLLAPSLLLPFVFGLAWGVGGVAWGIVADAILRTAYYSIANVVTGPPQVSIRSSEGH